MKRKIISVLLCVCMLAGVMSMAGLALDTTIPNEAKIDLDRPLEIDKGTTEASIQSGISNYLNISNADVSYSNIKTYFTPTVELITISGEDYVQVTLTEKAANHPSGFKIIDLSTRYGEEDDSGSLEIITLLEKVTWVTKLYDLQIGVRKYGENGNNLVASNIATVTATVNATQATSVQDKIYDLQYDDTVTLTATLKTEYEDYYEFFCWVDGAGNVKQYDPTVTVIMRESCAVFAVYRDKADRYVVTYDSNEGGKIVFSDGENLKIFEGDGQVSVFEGSSPKFTFVPDEGYEVSKVVVNEDGTPKEVSSIKSLLSALFNASDFDDALSIFGTYADATNKDVYSYTFKNIARNATISVTFIKSKVYEPASGVEYVPGPELSTDAADADGDGAGATTLPAENDGSSNADVVNPQTGSTTAIAAFATLSLAAAAAFVTAKKKRS